MSDFDSESFYSENDSFIVFGEENVEKNSLPKKIFTRLSTSVYFNQSVLLH